MSNAYDLLVGAQRFVIAALRVQPGRRDQTIEQQRQQLVAAWSRLPEIPTIVSSQVLEALGDSSNPFPAPVNESLASALLDIVASQAGGFTRDDTGSKQQSCRTLYNYLVDSLWAALGSTDSVDNKLRLMSDFMLSTLGLRRPSEPTQVLAVAIIHVASGLSPNPDHAYRHVHDLKSIMKTKRSFVRGVENIRVFPEDPADFQRLFPSAYLPGAPPVACRVDIASVLERCRADVIPARNSSSKVASHRGRAAASPLALQNTAHASPSSMMNPQNLTPALVSHLLGHTQAAPEIPLRFLGGLGGQSGAAAPSYDERLAITDRPAQSLASSPEKLVDARSGCDSASIVPPSDPASVAVPPGMSERSVDSRQSLSGAAGGGLVGNFADLKANVMASIAKAESVTLRKKPAKSEQLAALPDGSMPLLDGDGLGVSGVDDEFGEDVEDQSGVEVKPKAASKKRPASAIIQTISPASAMSPAPACRVRIRGKSPAPIVIATPAAPTTPAPAPSPGSTSPFSRISLQSIFKDPDLVTALRKATPLFPRPPPSKKATFHAGGRLYWLDKASSWRIYVRSGDRAEQRIRVDWTDAGQVQRQWNLALAVIERDPRPFF